jgi:hypothetical protein
MKVLLKSGKSKREPIEKRIRLRDTEGLDLPTELEIEEGAAHLEFFKTKNMEAGERWKELTLLLYADCLRNAEGWPCASRCFCCHVVAYGRDLSKHPCGACGGQTGALRVKSMTVRADAK